MAVRVADASAVAAVLFGEPGAEAAAAELEQGDPYAPTLLPYELASVARKKIRAHPGQAASILGTLERLEDLAISFVDADPIETVRLALRERLSAYDASYLWLAERLGGRLVTLDHALAKVARRRARAAAKLR